MLASRLLTALVLVPLVFLGVLRLPTAWFALLAGLVVLAAGWELARLSGLARPAGRLAAVTLLAVLLSLLWTLRETPWAERLLWLLAAWWVVNLLVLLSGRYRPRPFDGVRPLRLAAGLGLLSGAWLALVALHGSPGGPVRVMLFLVLVWIADSAAYFAGRRWGHRKLAPLISPGKTVEGAAGALAAALLCALVAWAAGWRAGLGPADLALLGVVTAAVSIGGDLWESVLKRECGLKDSGSLLPGHGGVLDRIDSQVAAAPFFWAGLRLLGGPG